MVNFFVRYLLSALQNVGPFTQNLNINQLPHRGKWPLLLLPLIAIKKEKEKRNIRTSLAEILPRLESHASILIFHNPTSNGSHGRAYLHRYLGDKGKESDHFDLL